MSDWYRLEWFVDGVAGIKWRLIRTENPVYQTNLQTQVFDSCAVAIANVVIQMTDEICKQNKEEEG